MANTSQAEKRARQAERHRRQNASQRNMLRTYMKKVVKAIEVGTAADAQASFTAAVPVIDRMARRGLIHKNKAARHKSRLNARIRAMAS